MKTDTFFDDVGASKLSEALMINTTLADVDLNGDDKADIKPRRK